MRHAIRDYMTVTAAYWGFTLTDGALRMLVVLYFHQLGYGALDIALLFLFYEFFGVVTNLFGGWLGARWGLNRTMFVGLVLQIGVLVGLAQEQWLSIVYVMVLQALSGIAKDLNKMSAKSSLKALVPDSDSANNPLFKWVSILTGSKNALKGIGFFIGGALLGGVGYETALYVLAAMLTMTSSIAFVLLPSDMGRKKYKPKFTEIFSTSQNINTLSAARFCLFGARDIWFVIALPVFMQAQLNWTHTEVGILMASWVIGYGIVQSLTPTLLGLKKKDQPSRQNMSLAGWALLMAAVPSVMVAMLWLELPTQSIIVFGLLLFAVIFAINSALHSYWILAYAREDGAAMDVGFYYMANAGGRLIGTVLSGALYQYLGLVSCLIGSAVLLLLSSAMAKKLR